jgi:hypothetical protein
MRRHTSLSKDFLSILIIEDNAQLAANLYLISAKAQ